jgi:CubicO group peptidase (beta-lactamase class C family)
MRRFRPILYIPVVFFSAGCGGVPSETAPSDGTVPDWVVYPEKEWQTITPEQAFPDQVQSGTSGHAAHSDLSAWKGWVGRMNEQVKGASKDLPQYQRLDNRENQGGVAIAWGGYLLQTFGDPDFRVQTASLGKAFTMACLQLAIDQGLINSATDLVKDYWTGEGELNAPHKYLNQGHHDSLTFLHLVTHRGGFPITNGYTWKDCKTPDADAVAPPWSKCTGDPDSDNYAHAQPGTVGQTYSSGAYWRLGQALTAIWKKDLKQVMDEKLFSKMGIPADRWDWTPGQTVHDNSDYYPKMPGYGLYLDPPYTISGQTVRGGPGWVVMSAKDLARFGLLIATGGIWKGERLITGTNLLRAHSGGGGSNVNGVGGSIMVSWGKVTAEGINFSDIPLHLFARHQPSPGGTR